MIATLIAWFRRPATVDPTPAYLFGVLASVRCDQCPDVEFRVGWLGRRCWTCAAEAAAVMCFRREGFTLTHADVGCVYQFGPFVNGVPDDDASLLAAGWMADLHQRGIVVAVEDHTTGEIVSGEVLIAESELSVPPAEHST